MLPTSARDENLFRTVARLLRSGVIMDDEQVALVERLTRQTVRQCPFAQNTAPRPGSKLVLGMPQWGVYNQ
ncbi:hypothetical protein FNYG_07849 [Fusarium nygamai]|uniref:Uncharacterized protein n=1 Tax=Gibberella nygamai TaxID=42673 RepID=A0A2K0W939_GIBNY|nr:hypothetical protein FNYG_07849 [Fusarium nygamai]